MTHAAESESSTPSLGSRLLPPLGSFYRNTVLPTDRTFSWACLASPNASGGRAVNAQMVSNKSSTRNLRLGFTFEGMASGGDPGAGVRTIHAIRAFETRRELAQRQTVGAKCAKERLPRLCRMLPGPAPGIGPQPVADAQATPPFACRWMPAGTCASSGRAAGGEGPAGSRRAPTEDRVHAGGSPSCRGTAALGPPSSIPQRSVGTLRAGLRRGGSLSEPYCDDLVAGLSEDRRPSPELTSFLSLGDSCALPSQQHDDATRAKTPDELSRKEQGGRQRDGVEPGDDEDTNDDVTPRATPSEYRNTLHSESRRLNPSNVSPTSAINDEVAGYYAGADDGLDCDMPVSGVAGAEYFKCDVETFDRSVQRRIASSRPIAPPLLATALFRRMQLQDAAVIKSIQQRRAFDEIAAHLSRFSNDKDRLNKTTFHAFMRSICKRDASQHISDTLFGFIDQQDNADVSARDCLAGFAILFELSTPEHAVQYFYNLLHCGSRMPRYVTKYECEMLLAVIHRSVGAAYQKDPKFQSISLALNAVASGMVYDSLGRAPLSSLTELFRVSPALSFATQTDKLGTQRIVAYRPPLSPDPTASKEVSVLCPASQRGDG
ncbi:hypothetical protein DIPPA_21521 [Diplonema papillatum]|nr:hypothetical protein DIPPA_21521 [Diplonema papillatum]